MSIYRWFFIFLIFILALLSGAGGWWWLPPLLVLILGLASYIQPLLRRELIIAGLLFAAGFLYACYAFALPEIADRDGETVVLQGVVSSYPQQYDNRLSFDFKPDHADAALATLRISLYAELDQTLMRGERVELRGTLQRPAPAGNPGQFNYRAYLEQQRIYYTLSLPRADALCRLETSKRWEPALSGFRQDFIDWVEDHLSAEESAVLLGMLLGRKEAIDEERYSSFQQAGVVHLFAVSGLHVGFLILLAAWLTGLGRIRPGLRLLISLILLFLYGSLVGWPVPVTRASIMAALIMLAHYGGRQGQSFNALALAGIIILLVDPQALFTASFQLSFLAAGGLVWLFPRLRAVLRQRHWMIDALLVPFCAQLAVLPLIVYYFHLLSPISVLANMLVTWLACAAVIMGFLSIFLFPWQITLFLYPAGMLVELIMRLTDFLIAIPGACLMAASVSPLIIVCYYGGIIILGWHWEGRVKQRESEWAGEACRSEEDEAGIEEGELTAPSDAKAKAVASMEPPGVRCWRRYSWVVAIGLMVLVPIQAFYPAAWRERGMLEVVFVDVGQGDAILIKSPKGKFMLVDGGGSESYDVGAKVLLPYLYHRGIRRIDMIVSSHPDSDHLRGLESVASILPVERIALAGVTENDAEYETLMYWARQKDIACHGLKQGDIIQWDGELSLEILHPPRSMVYAGDDNNASLVMGLRWREFSMLLTGDIEQEGQRDLMQSAGPGRFQVLKVPHHGSRYSWTPGFYERIQPQIAVISVGRNNWYGHPHAEVLAALEEQGVFILRTDRDGALRLLSDGKELWISSTRGRFTCVD